ncbi:MAG: hypothetical protein KDA99_18595, partial [Planctomycetales bacterium]|nr:hypothetical protein [Planctomycetales bacterium]
AADYTIWKDSFGSVDNLRADGNENGVVDAADYTIWKDNFGLSIVEVHTVPEPHWWAILRAVASAAGPATRRKNQ